MSRRADPFILSTLFEPVMYSSNKLCEHLPLYLLLLHLVTDDLYHNWSVQVHIYSGPYVILSWKDWITFDMECLKESLPWEISVWLRFELCTAFLKLSCAFLFSSLTWSGLKALPLCHVSLIVPFVAFKSLIFINFYSPVEKRSILHSWQAWD